MKNRVFALIGLIMLLATAGWANEVGIVARHAEGWYPGVDVSKATIVYKTVVDRNPSWFSKVFKGQKKLWHHEILRVDFPSPPPGVKGCHADECIFYTFNNHNLNTIGGTDCRASQMGNTSTQCAPFTYIGLTNDSGAPAAGDCAAGSTSCTLASEITTNGLSRAQGTYAHTNGTNTWTLSKTFTATGSQSAQKAAMFNASSSGTYGFETAFSQVTLANTDILTIIWTVTI